jgi:hypothetical protein
MMCMKLSKRLLLLSAAVAATILLMQGCGGHIYTRKSSGPSVEKNRKNVSVQAPSRDRIDKFNSTYVCCKALEDFKNSGYRPDFKKAYFIQEGKELVNTMFAPLNDTSKNLLMIKIVGSNATFPLSVTYMEETAYMKHIVSTMQSYYHFSEDSTVAIIASYNGKKLTQCPILSIRSCKHIAKTLLKNVLKEENEAGE